MASDTPVPAPTPADLSRDLAADLRLCDRYHPEECPWDPDSFGGRACVGWPAAIRRAEYAEVENKRLRAALDDLWHFYDDPGAGSLPKTVARRVCEALGRPVPEHYQGDEWDG